MEKIVRESFVCPYCGAEHETERKADKCYFSHDIVFVGLERREWKALVRSIVEATYQGIYFDPKVVDKLLKFKTGVSR